MQQLETPKTLKTLIIATCCISLLYPLISFLLFHFFAVPDATNWLPLSLYGLERGWAWQVLTYFFIQTSGTHISLSLFISLFFVMFLLWFAGKEVVSRFGARRFLILYLGSGILAGLVGAACLYLFSDQTSIVGSSSAVFATLVVWAMLYADLHLYYFFIFRIKAKILIGILFVIPLVLHLATGAFALFFTELTGIIAGYIFGLTLFGLSPLFEMKWKSHKKQSSKVIDIGTLIDDDEAFMDRMLAKIARLGESSLSPKERSRMDAISRKKRP
jgi:membrane associated rhomboid family serine protease